MQEAADRVRAAVEAVRSLPHPFMLTARADNHFYGVQNLADTIARLQAYQEAGADVLFAPGLKTRDEVVAVMSSIDRPLNVLLGFADSTLTLDDMHELGVRRVSVGGSFARTAYSALIRAAQTIQTTGRFEHAKGAIPGPLLNRLFGDGLSLAERQTMLAQRYLNKGE
jgi:2-methylisocitrate lyase-like PEP mutase family enzyme